LPAEKKHPPPAELGALLRHYQSGQYNDAEKLGRSITRRYPGDQLGWKVLGATLNQAQKLQESLVPNQKAVELDPKDAEAHVILGSTLQQLGRLEQAEASYKKAIALRPTFAAVHWEQCEFKALNEFVAQNSLSYEVVAISSFTKQVAVKLIGI
jgi:tetratricopeptide (TPR) repeat protein